MINKRLGILFIVAAGACVCLPAQAFRFDLWGIQASWETRLVAGAAWRTDDRAEETIGKLNLNPGLCPDDCLSLSGDPGPNQRLVNAPGAFLGSNFDNGNLNYDKGDLVTGQVRIKSELSGFWGDVAFKVSALGFYDFVNTNFEATHPDTAFQPARTDRLADPEELVGTDVDLLEAFVSIPFSLLDHRFHFSVGQQRIRWGESTFVARGSLDMINPPNANRLHFPGASIAAVFEPTGVAVLSTRFTRNISAQFVYQYDWEAVEPPAAGSFFSFSDIAGGGAYANVTLGQFSEAPPRFSENYPGGTLKTNIAHLITDTYTSVPVDHERGKPEEGGQYGMRLTWFTLLNGGTEFSLYALNYHSRLPLASAVATDATCLRGPSADPNLVTNLATALENTLGADLTAVKNALGGVGSVLDAITGATPPVLANTLTGLGALASCGLNLQFDATAFLNGTNDEPLTAQDALPLDTVGVFTKYPEDIHMFGISFNTNIGKWSLAGEYAFRPNQPLQVSLADVVFAAVQPALPEQDVFIGVATIPSARSAAPDYLQTRYRQDPVQANEVIYGFERFKVSQFDLTGLRIFSAGNWIGANQIIWLVEVGFTRVWDMPSMDKLQIGAFGPNCTHYGFGADGTGTIPPGAQDADPVTNSDGQPGQYTQVLNPTQARGCFADDFAWGYRTLMQITYSDLLFGWDIKPVLFFGHDVGGVAPFPVQNFVEGRKHGVIGTNIVFTNQFSAGLEYEIFWGSGDRISMLQDRDNIGFHLSYTF